ncbi:hypothetical protein ACFLQ6_00165 [Thermoproteota archaeon]
MSKRSNVGEVDEPIIIEKLVSLKGKYVEPFNDMINSVKSYDGIEYQVGIKRNQISKAPVWAKRDVLINGKGYSLKSTRAAPPAIVNHTTREKWLRVCTEIRVRIDKLDIMVSEYWKLRKGKRIGEDVNANNPLCPFVNSEERRLYLKPLINYFLFNGTGSKSSQYPADFILEFDDPTNNATWKIFDKNSAFDTFWPNMVFSVRSKKGMPSKYPNIGYEIKCQIEPWVKFIDGDYRGALHIRSKKDKPTQASLTNNNRKYF